MIIEKILVLLCRDWEQLVSEVRRGLKRKQGEKRSVHSCVEFYVVFFHCESRAVVDMVFPMFEAYSSFSYFAFQLSSIRVLLGVGVYLCV